MCKLTLFLLLILTCLITPSQICLAKKKKPSEKTSVSQMKKDLQWAENAMEKSKDTKEYCVRLTKTINMVRGFIKELETYQPQNEGEDLVVGTFPSLLEQMEDKDREKCPLDLFTTEEERRLLRLVTAELKKSRTDRTCEELKASYSHATTLRTQLAKSWIISPKARQERGEIIEILIDIQQENSAALLEMHCPPIAMRQSSVRR